MGHKWQGLMATRPFTALPGTAGRMTWRLDLHRGLMFFCWLKILNLDTFLKVLTILMDVFGRSLKIPEFQEQTACYFFFRLFTPKKRKAKTPKRLRCALRPVNQGTFHLWENSTCRSWTPPNRLCPGGRLGSLKSEVTEKMGKHPCLFTFKVSGRSSLQFRGGVFQVSMWNHTMWGPQVMFVGLDSPQ